MHILAYSEMLHAWGLVQQRAQLHKILRLHVPGALEKLEPTEEEHCMFYIFFSSILTHAVP